ncbi:GNAT family N-acetyltransferase [Marininema halotolerans]|uniref:Protein N-acetyltransferase, RimJ/RimL family n=1 Tax=Marininema halotolerans TaxID=1155944 RepID=A0A1I6RM60_9BACL|nr:GNAT family protein [Marininema halotolerans]SFS65833.1 Protein N-acetyltransferase, RimJ/RimL family [Marininema halotolerans]
MNKPIFLQGERLYLRPISEDDSERYFLMMFNQETRRFTGSQRSFTKEQIQRYIADQSHDSSRLLLLIALKEDHSVIGDIQLLDIDPLNRNCYLRISLDDPRHQGKGYGNEAMKLMLDYAFGILNLHRIELNVYAYNDRAIRLYEKLGFKKEGVQRDALFYDHTYHDSIIMSMLEDEYRERYRK